MKLLLPVLCLGLFSCTKKEPSLKIVKEELIRNGYEYIVKGSVHNPEKKAAENVTIRYEVWSKLKGKPSGDKELQNSGGLATATLKYVPAGQTVEFTATGKSVPVMSKESGLIPDPLKAEISAEWSE